MRQSQVRKRPPRLRPLEGSGENTVKNARFFEFCLSRKEKVDHDQSRQNCEHSCAESQTVPFEVSYAFCLSHLSVLFKCVNASSGMVGIGFPSRARRVRPGTRVKAERGSTRRRLKPRSRT